MAILENLEAMLATGEDNSLLRFGLGQAYLNLKQYDKAAMHLEKCLEFDADYSAAWKLLGKAHAANNNIEQAVLAYEQGIRVAEQKGDLQTAREIQVFRKRLTR